MTKTASPLSIAFGGCAMLAIGVGVARFSYTPILPAMRAEAGLEVLSAGYLATANYLGYLIGALWPILARQLRLSINAHLMLLFGLLLALATTLAMSFTDSFLPWATIRLLSGIASAWLMIYASAIVLDASAKYPSHVKSLLGIHYAGVGCGIVLSGLLIALLELFHVDWRGLWLAEAGLILVLLPCALKIQTRVAALPPGVSHQAPSSSPSGPVHIGWLVAAYFCAGLGYIVSATFLPTIAKQHPQLAAYASWGWVLVGIAAIPSNYLWTWMLARTSYVTALVAAFGLQALGVVLPALSATPLALLASAMILGGTFMGIVTVANANARLAAPNRTAEIVAAMTAAYGIGQILGPIIAGKLAAVDGHFSNGLWIASLTLCLGIASLVIGAHRLKPKPLPHSARS